jgi:hypothetical protein
MAKRAPRGAQRLRGRLQLHEVRHLMRQVVNKINAIDFNNLPSASTSATSTSRS